MYLLVYIRTKALPLQEKLFNSFGRTSHPTHSSSGVSGIAALATLLSTTRMALRLMGLPPLYAWLRHLLRGPQHGQGHILFATALMQCVLSMAFQIVENVALLIDRNVLSPRIIGRSNQTEFTKRMYIWSARAWLAGVLCDFVRLAREYQLRSNRSGKRSSASEENKSKAREDWWSEILVPLGWMPVAIHFSLTDGLPGFNLGMMGLTGGVAGLGRFAKLWRATASQECSI